MTLSAPEGPAQALNEARLGEIRARARLKATLGDTRARLSPARLVAEASEALRAKGADLLSGTLDRTRQRPAAAAAITGAIVLLLLRKPIARGISALISSNDETGADDEPFEPR